MKNERRDQRVPLGIKIRYKSATVSEFLEQHSRDVSKGGVFIRTDRPMPAGTLIKFDFRLSDERSLIQGVGRVVWRRDEPIDDNQPAGMGIKFIKLDESSRQNLDHILKERVVGGDTKPSDAPTVETMDKQPSAEPEPITPVGSELF